MDEKEIELNPGNYGKDCPGNGEHIDKNGYFIPCLCDACDFMMCCLESNWREKCITCKESECPHFRKRKS